jgi:hypothetical protein
MAGALESQCPITGRRSSPPGERGIVLGRACGGYAKRGSAFTELNVSEEEEVVCRP